MGRYAFLVVRPQLSSPNPHFSKPRIWAANWDIWSRLTHELLGRLKFTIPILQIYSPKKANFEKLGLGLDNPCRIVFLSLQMNTCLERVNDRHFWNPGVFSYAMIPRCRPNSRVFFFIVQSIVYGQNHRWTEFDLMMVCDWRNVLSQLKLIHLSIRCRTYPKCSFVKYFRQLETTWCSRLVGGR
jgi:hypothetical protein